MARSRQQFVLLCAGTLCHFIAMGIFLSALPLFVTGPLAGTRASVGLAVGGFSVSAVLLRPFIGRSLDARGRRPFLLAAPCIMLVTSAGFLVAQSVVVVVVLRLAQGVAGACYYTAGATVATDLAPLDRRAEYVARFSLFLYGGLAVGPALGEALVDVGYDWAWAAAAACAVATFTLVYRVHETASGHGRAAAIATAGAGAAREARGGGGPGGDEGLGGRAVADGTDGAAIATRADGGRRRPQLLHPASVGPGVVILTAAVGYSAITSFTALYARKIGMSSSGALYATFAVTVLVVRLIAGRLADRHGRITVALPGMAAGAAGLALLAAQPPHALAFLGVGAFAAGFALVFPALMALTVDRAHESERGAAVGSFTAFFDIGAALGSYVVGLIADYAGFGGAFAFPAGLCAVGFVVLVRLGRRVRDQALVAAAEAPLPEPAGA